MEYAMNEGTIKYNNCINKFVIDQKFIEKFKYNENVKWIINFNL